MSETEERLRLALADRYRLERELGVGGMATVFLAQDLKHDRKVALKVLKPELAAVLGAERFVVEIKTTAALQHPHILPLFDSGTADGFLYYVMPFIQGETLRTKLDRETQLGIDEAVKLTIAVADALDYAHRQGVIHRDIKPENILLHDGRPMVADFGIALAVSAAAGGRMTETGLSLGTPHYMSPEQATGEREITGRSDIYSLGSVLYEMLTGNPPHTGASAQQIIMKIVTEDAAPVTKLRRAVPPNIAAAVAKSLEKLPADRFATAAEFAAALADSHFTSSSTVALRAAHGAARSWRGWLRDPRSWAALLAVAALTSTTLLARRQPPTRATVPETLRFTVSGPADSSVLSLRVRGGYAIGEPVVSPDSRHLAFNVNRSSGTALYVRALDAFEPREVPGEGYWPFFSPDGRSLGFFRENEVWTLALSELAPSRVGALPERGWDITSVAWHPDGRILVNASRGLWALPASGGEPALLVPADSAARERFTDVGLLPDGRILLGVTARAGARTEVLSPDGAERMSIVPGLEQVRVVGDILFFVQAGQQRASRFDFRRLEPVGRPIALSDFPSQRPGPSVAWLDGSSTPLLELVWTSRDGRVTPLGLESGYYRWPRVAPGGDRIVMGRVGSNFQSQLVAVHVARRTSAPLAGSTEPVWTPDGRHIIASTGNRPLGGLVIELADGSRAPDTLLSLETGDAWPTDVSPDGRWLAFYGATLGSGSEEDARDENDLQFMELEKREVRRVRIDGFQRGARFSPDGRWVAYQSTESGREQVHLRPWPALDANFVLSTDGGTEPTWSPDGREVYYRYRDAIMAVPVAASGATIERAPPRQLFAGVFSRDNFGDQSYDVAPDGRFLMLRPIPGGKLDIRVALNWIADVRARLERAP